MVENAGPLSSEEQKPARALRQLRLAGQLGNHMSLAFRLPSQPAPVGEPSRGSKRRRGIRGACFQNTSEQPQRKKNSGMAFAKLVVILFFFFAWLAIKLVLRRQSA